MEIDSAWIALIGTLSGGVGLKTVEWFLNRSKAKSDLDAAYRDELRKDLAAMRQELDDAKAETDRVQKELDAMREKYFDVKRELNEVLVQLALKLGKSDINDLH